jgi:hypothetical protein
MRAQRPGLPRAWHSGWLIFPALPALLRQGAHGACVPRTRLRQSFSVRVRFYWMPYRETHGIGLNVAVMHLCM